MGKMKNNIFSFHLKNIWFRFYVYWHISFPGLIKAKAILVEEEQGYYLTNHLENKNVHCFPKKNLT